MCGEATVVDVCGGAGLGGVEGVRGGGGGGVSVVNVRGWVSIGVWEMYGRANAMAALGRGFGGQRQGHGARSREYRVMLGHVEVVESLRVQLQAHAGAHTSRTPGALSG